eukprot:1551436-Amphidinium_carterae.6
MAARDDDSNFFQASSVKLCLQVLLRDYSRPQSGPNALTTQLRPAFALTQSSEHTGLAIPQPSEEEDAHSDIMNMLRVMSPLLHLLPARLTMMLCELHILSGLHRGREADYTSVHPQICLCLRVAHTMHTRTLVRAYIWLCVLLVSHSEWCSRCLARLDRELADVVRKYDPREKDRHLYYMHLHFLTLEFASTRSN